MQLNLLNPRLSRDAFSSLEHRRPPARCVALASAIFGAVLAVSAASLNALASDTAPSHIAQILNARFADISECKGPPYSCNGVIVRSTQQSDSGNEWDPSPIAISLGSVTFSYLRKDVGPPRVHYLSGFVFDASAVGMGGPQPRCFYPFLAGTQQLPDHGCGNVANAPNPGPDFSSCAAIKVTTADQWVEKFKEDGLVVAKQCSMSTVDAGQFQAAIAAHSMVNDALTATPNELLISTWIPEDAQRLPITAFFYMASADVGQTSQALAEARSYKAKYMKLYGTTVPVVRVDVNVVNKPFSYREEDQQASGVRVVERLNARLNSTVQACADNKPAYYCSGVTVRGTSQGDYNEWDPTPAGITHGSISFSWLRRDLITAALYVNRSGFALADQETAIKEGKEIPYRCIYPFDANTTWGGTREDFLCTPPLNRQQPDWSSCVNEGVTSEATWNAYMEARDWDYAKQCSFSTQDARQFMLAREIHNSFHEGQQRTWYNEALLQTWEAPPADEMPKVERLPIEVFYWQEVNPITLSEAQSYQRDYQAIYNRVVPIARLSFTDNKPLFEYVDIDQVVRP